MGNTGTPTDPRFARGECPDSEAGPVRPCRGLEWVVRVLGRTGPVYAVLRPPLRTLQVLRARFAVSGLLGAGPGSKWHMGEIPSYFTES